MPCHEPLCLGPVTNHQLQPWKEGRIGKIKRPPCVPFSGFLGSFWHCGRLIRQSALETVTIDCCGETRRQDNGGDRRGGQCWNAKNASSPPCIHPSATFPHLHPVAVGTCNTRGEKSLRNSHRHHCVGDCIGKNPVSIGKCFGRK